MRIKLINKLKSQHPHTLEKHLMDHKGIKRHGRTFRRLGKRLGWELHEYKHARTVMREAMKESEFIGGGKGKLRIRHEAIWGAGK